LLPSLPLAASSLFGIIVTIFAIATIIAVVTVVALVAVIAVIAVVAIVAVVAVVAIVAIALFAPVTVALAAVVIALTVVATTVLAVATALVPSWLLCPLSPSSLGEVSIITLVTFTLVTLNPLLSLLLSLPSSSLPSPLIMGSTPLVRRCRSRCSLSSTSGAAAATRGSLLHNGWLLRRRIGTSTLLSLSQLPSSLPSLRDCYRPSTLTEESSQKKEKAEKVYFYFYGNNF
jgi:hypothetical protein